MYIEYIEDSYNNKTDNSTFLNEQNMLRHFIYIMGNVQKKY